MRMRQDTISRTFESLVRHRGPQPLILTSHRSWNASEVSEMAAQLGRALQAGGVPPHSLVGLAAPNGPGFVAGFLALRAHGAAVLLLDAATPAPERERICRALGAVGQLTAREPRPANAEWYSLVLSPHGPDHEPVPLPPEVAVVRLTSGSSGAPKGIVHSDATLLADDLNLASTMGLRAEDSILASVPLSHAYGFGSIFIPAIARGSRIVVPPDTGPFAPIEAARDSDVTFFPTVPAYLQALSKMSEPPPLPPSVRLVISAGAPLQPATARRLRRSWGLPVRVFYGASEVGGITFDREGTAAERGTVGSPVDGVSVDLQSTPTAGDEEGVVVVRSAAVALGYLPNPDETLARGRFLTQDLARWQGDELQLIARVDSLINIRGKMVNPREVELMLEQLPEVDEAIVLAVPTDGSPESRLAAVLVSRDSSLTSERVRAWSAENLAPYKIPRRVTIVAEIPRTSRGKLDRSRILALACGGR